jgi:hypothetical protein
MPLLGTQNGVANDIIPDDEEGHRYAAMLDIPMSPEEYDDLDAFARVPSAMLRISSRSSLAQVGVDVTMMDAYSLDQLDYENGNLRVPVIISLESNFARAYYRHAIYQLIQGRQIARAFVTHEDGALKHDEIYELYKFPDGHQKFKDLSGVLPDAVGIPMIPDTHYEINVANITEGHQVLKAVLLNGRNALLEVLKPQKGEAWLKRTLVSAFRIQSRDPLKMPPTHIVLQNETTHPDANHFQPIWLDIHRVDGQHMSLDGNMESKDARQKRRKEDKEAGVQAFQIEYKHLKDGSIPPKEVRNILTLMNFYRAATIEDIQNARSLRDQKLVEATA